MFYIIYGKDTFRSREKVKSLLAILNKENPGSDNLVLDEDNYSLETLQGLLNSQTLFGGKRFVVCSELFQNKEFYDFLVRKLESFSASPNVFIFLEGVLKKETLAVFKKYAKGIEGFDFLIGVKLEEWFKDKKINLSEKRKIIEKCGSDLWCSSKEIERIVLREGNVSGVDFLSEKELPAFNLFSLSDAVALRDRKKTWILFNKALLSGIPVEEIFYKVLWQIKNLLLVKSLSETSGVDLAKESGLHPFVLKKTLSAVRKFSNKELSSFSFNLVNLFHNSRWGVEDLAIGMERFLIGI